MQLFFPSLSVLFISGHLSEISLNSRNPTAQISIIPKNQISPDWLLPDLPHTFIRRFVYKPHLNILYSLVSKRKIGLAE